MSRATPRDHIPRRAGYGHGSYRRAIVLEAEPGRSRGELADDFHHFAARIEHDGAAVTAIQGEGIRVPWTTCSAAETPLEALVGAPIEASLPAVARHTDPKAQCTHWYDVACLAITQAARRGAGLASTRRYDFSLPDRREGQSAPVLDRDGERVLSWEVEGLRVRSSNEARFAGLALNEPDFGRTVAESDADLAEAALIMRRGVFIGLGRRYDFEAIRRAAQFAPVVGAACHTFDPARLDQAVKIPGTVRDFHDAPERIFEREG